MTCVVGVVDEGRVWMGADSLGASGYDVTMRQDPKVYVNGPFLIGFTDSFRMGQLLAFNLKVELPSGDLFQYMATKFVDAVRTTLREGGWARKTDEAEKGGQFLVGLQGQLFVIESDYQVAIPRLGYDAIGCGASYALGSLYATENDEMSVEARITVALEAAAEFSAGVRGPWAIVGEQSR